LARISRRPLGYRCLARINANRLGPVVIRSLLLRPSLRLWARHESKEGCRRATCPVRDRRSRHSRDIHCSPNNQSCSGRGRVWLGPVRMLCRKTETAERAGRLIHAWYCIRAETLFPSGRRIAFFTLASIGGVTLAWRSHHRAKRDERIRDEIRQKILRPTAMSMCRSEGGIMSTRNGEAKIPACPSVRCGATNAQVPVMLQRADPAAFLSSRRMT